MVAHRGASDVAAEHTLEAYVEAIEVGADGLECDVRLTADGHLVLVHDATIERTSDGRGRVSAMTLAELRRQHWRSESEAPLTLRQLFELVRDCGRRVEVAVETKHPNRYGGRTEEAVCDLMDWFGWLPLGERGAHRLVERCVEPTPIRVMSFSAAALRRVHARAPRTPLVYLVEKPLTAATRPALPGGAFACGVDIALLTSEPGWVRAIRAAGHDLHVWTVNSQTEIDTALAAGASALITDRPAAALTRLGRRLPTVSATRAKAAPKQASE